MVVIFFFQAEDGIRDDLVTGVQTCALPISSPLRRADVEIRRMRALLRMRVRLIYTCSRRLSSQRRCDRLDSSLMSFPLRGGNVSPPGRTDLRPMGITIKC